MYTIDFESEAIDGNTTVNPPKPVGVAIKHYAHKAKYYAWGHPTKNNCSYEEGLSALKTAWYSGEPLLFHNAKFDVPLAVTHMGLVFPRWDLIEDTLYLLFFENPYSDNLSLKPNSERILSLPATEQDDLHRWILSHVKEATPKTAGAYISKAPGDLVGKYAISDVDRTYEM